MMKRFFNLLMALFVLVIMAGCGGGGQKETGGQPADSQPAKEESVTGLLSKGKKVEGLFYEYKMTAKDMTMTGKMWLAGNKMKIEAQVGGQKVINIFDGGNILHLYAGPENGHEEYSG
ncbi:MAG: hypothetical protein M1609_04265 [Firmicutes bacterium]|nr:hypothetical protein [Bacillota bacterium]